MPRCVSTALMSAASDVPYESLLRTKTVTVPAVRRRPGDPPTVTQLDEIADDGAGHQGSGSTVAPVSVAYSSASARSAAVKTRMGSGWPGGRTISVRSASDAGARVDRWRFVDSVTVRS